jgi:UDP-GlcNAc:undecaprenyl-phosphate/decaprenyl-phosphate GlcNAc-1-phosphate transferase
MLYIFLVLALFALELLYFKIAIKFNIVDKPNERSSHKSTTIRGGGIIFWISALAYFLYSDFQYPYFFIGLTFVTFVSFLDDIITLPNRYRFPVQFLAIILCLYQLNYTYNPIWLYLGILIISVGILNAYNFMDGINGITGGYSLITIISFWLINNYTTAFIENAFLYFLGISLIIFNYFNFRNKAMCFAGDVGSISMAFIVIFLLLKLVSKTNNYSYIILLSVYGVDSVLTIIQRLLKGENIFKAHRSHFFQILVSNAQKSHIAVASIYSGLQFTINCIFIYYWHREGFSQWVYTIFIIFLLAITYISIKAKILKTKIN